MSAFPVFGALDSSLVLTLPWSFYVCFDHFPKLLGFGVVMFSKPNSGGKKLQSWTPPCSVSRALGLSLPCDAHGAESDDTSLRSAIPLPAAPGI